MSKTRDASSNDIAALYSALIKGSKPGELLPFLQAYAGTNKTALRQEIKKARKYWFEYINLSNESGFRMRVDRARYGPRATQKQEEIILLSAIALLDKTEIMRWAEALAIFSRINEPRVLEIIEWVKPTWINAYLLAQLRKSEWATINYIHLRMLEERRLVEYDPELFALSMARFPGWTYGQPEPQPQLTYINYIINDSTAWQRDVPLLFEYETRIQGQFFAKAPGEAYNSGSIWERIFFELLVECKADRGWFIENCILVQTKEWNGGLRTFFRKRLIEASPIAAELIAVQYPLFACLHAQLNVVVNFGVEQIRMIWNDAAFDFKSFIEFVEPVMMRADCKGSIRHILAIFDKAAAQKPEHRAAMSLLVADAFVIPDLTLQERVWKTLTKIGDETDPLLSDKLTMYLPQMQGNLPEMLESFLHSNRTEESVLYENYFPETREYTMLNEDARVPEFSTWNDLLFHFGKYFQSWEVIDAERLLDAFITKRHLFPADAFEQLKPYASQLGNTHFAAKFKNWVSGFLLHVILGDEGIYAPEPSEYERSNVSNLTRALIIKAQQKIAAESKRSLLCFPTHTPQWIDPSILIDRLIAYHEAGEKIDPTDFAISISRTRRENIAAAQKKVQLLPDRYQALFAFILGASDHIVVSSEKPTIWKRLFKERNDDNLVPWAVAARTFYPDRVFSQFEQTDLRDAPNVVSPYIPEVRIDVKSNTVKSYFTHKSETNTWRQLSAALPQGKWNGKPGLLYSMDMSEYKKHTWASDALSLGGVVYWHSVTPQNDQALASYLMRYACQFPENEGHDDLRGFLHVTSHPGFRFTETVYYVLGCCCLYKDSGLRNYAAEVFLFLIGERRIDMHQLGGKLARLVFEGYAPLQRFLEVAATIRNHSALHNGALRTLLETILEGFQQKEKLPVGFKKLLEMYYDLLTKTRQAPGATVLQNLKTIPETTSLKQILKQLQTISQK
jgi:hypothetical protein